MQSVVNIVAAGPAHLLLLLCCGGCWQNVAGAAVAACPGQIVQGGKSSSQVAKSRAPRTRVEKGA